MVATKCCSGQLLQLYSNIKILHTNTQGKENNDILKIIEKKSRKTFYQFYLIKGMGDEKQFS